VVKNRNKLNRLGQPEEAMKTKRTEPKRLLAAAFAATLFVTSAIAADDTTTSTNVDIQTLEKQIQSLDQEVQELKNQQHEDQQTTARAIKSQAHVSVGADGVNFVSANSNFTASLHGLVQVDSRTFFENGQIPGIDGFLLRRARIIFAGTVFHSFDYYFQPEFAGNSPQILDAYLNYRNRPDLQLQAGKFKPPIGLEVIPADSVLLFNERALASNLVPYRDIGAELHGDVARGVFSYAVGIFNGLPDFNSTTINTNIEDNIAFGGRVFTMPFEQTSLSPLKGLGVGVSGTYEDDEPTASGLTPGFTTDGQEKFFTYTPATGTVVAHGTHWRISPQGYYYWGPLGVMAEYVVSDQEVSKAAASADIHNTAWEVSGGWILTGESASYQGGVVPRHPFNPADGGWGALQVVGRFAQLNVDHDAFPIFANPATSASGASAWAAGLNWYLNQNVRVNLSFSHTWFAGSASANPVTARDENVLFTRMQLAF
jgi:phosphate-selective porin OprO/OprP